MDGFALNINVCSIFEWPDEHVQRAWRLTSMVVRRLSALDVDHPERVEHLERAEGDAGMFGGELVRRQLV